ncbi:MAG: AAC(3) family N-acetyltransferase [Myxococcaceae bacterium]|nr:AAC(3) family N-acetyltransferase [Myxococcaceae bacterium]
MKTDNRQTLVSQLHALGVRGGDVLMLHASLRKLGLAKSQGVDDGAGLLLDALDEAVGPSGTLLMVLGTDYALDHVNFRPVEERAALLKGMSPFDYLNAKVLPEVGWLAEAFRLRPGAVLSKNPSGRFAARGGRADELVRDQPWHDYYGPGSPLEKLCQWGGRVLRLGSSLETVTVLHYAEYVTNVPNKRRTRWDYVLEQGHVFIECLNDYDGIVEWEGDDYFAAIMTEYLALKRHREGPVGRATAELCDAKDLVDFGARWMEKTFAPTSGQRAS